MHFTPFNFGQNTLSYIVSGILTMTINGLWNRRYGPGGGTRRLHQFRKVNLHFMGTK